MDRLWWKHGVVYQIYPRSFMDSNGDGVGDLEGIRSRLDHLAWLGVDAIWLSPCFPSPMADFGYDVSDYCDIAPLFGSLADFDRLLADAHERDIRIVLDWVPNHTSDGHAWFEASRKSRDDPHRDWYVWRDGPAPGEPPNNWVSIFGGPAWEWDDATGQWYLHSFLVEQPDLNWRNPDLVEAMHDVLRFWLDRGVDGFRIDVVQRLAKHPELRDNPPVPGGGDGYGGQRHEHDENHPDVHPLLQGIRTVLDAYPERMTVGEVYLMDPKEVALYYGAGDELHLAFNFPFLHSPWSAERFGHRVEEMEALLEDVRGSWPTLVLSNHDVPRHATRYDTDDPVASESRARAAALLLLTLRGAPYLYYGEEIGMRNVAIPRERMQDPLAATLHPNVCRDGERTPMQWEAGAGAGFTTGEPWLPVGSGRTVAAQREDRDSLLQLYRTLLALRRSNPALHAGSFRRLETSVHVLAYERTDPDSGQRALIALNFASDACEVALPKGNVDGGVSTNPARKLPETAGSLALGPDEAVVLLLRP